MGEEGGGRLQKIEDGEEQEEGEGDCRRYRMEKSREREIAEDRGGRVKLTIHISYWTRQASFQSSVALTQRWQQ